MSLSDTGIGPIGSLSMQALKDSLSGEGPPAGASRPVAALWHAAKSDFARARQAIEGDASHEAAWVRAHVMRCEGDHAGAKECYSAAGKPPSVDSRENEWNEIAAVALLRS